LSDAWNASTACEKRKDSELAKHWNIALPRQSTPEQQGELMRDMAQKITDRYGVMVTWAVHEASEHGDDRNAHGHLVLGTRTIDENGFGPKAAGLNGPKRKAELVWQREMFADTINRYLDGQGIDERVSAKSYKDRGIDQEPTLHMGNAVNQAELKGERTSIGDENRARKARNGERDNIDRAMTYLEELGTRGMTDEELRRIQGLIDDLNPKQTQTLQAYGREEADKDKTLKELTASGIKPKDAADMVESIIPLNPEAQKHISAFVADWEKERKIAEEREWLSYSYDRIVRADLSNAKALQAADVLGEMNGDGDHQIVQKKDKFILLYTPEEWMRFDRTGPSARREFHVTNSLDEMHDYIINRYGREEIETKTAQMDREYAIRQAAIAEKAAFEASETLRRESLDARAAARDRVAKPSEPTRQETYAKSEQLQAEIAAKTPVMPQVEIDARAAAKTFKPAPEPIISVEAKQAAKTVTRTADRGLMVAASATNKAMRLADFFSDFIAGPAPSKPKFTLDPVEISGRN
jgi:hypothetical protein